jgi:hypothetical protein
MREVQHHHRRGLGAGVLELDEPKARRVTFHVFGL